MLPHRLWQRPLFHALGLCRRATVATRRSLALSHFFSIPYAYVFHTDTLKCHPIQRQANTQNSRLPPYFSPKHIRNPRFPLQTSSLLLQRVSWHTYESMYWQWALHREQWKDAERDRSAATGMQSVDKVRPRSIWRHKISVKAKNR